MSRYCGKNVNTEAVLKAAEHWRQNGLLADNSIFIDKSLWKLEHFQALEQHFIDQPDDSQDNFIYKLSAQLKPTDPKVKQLAAELLWIMYLCPNNIGADRKREIIQTIWTWSGEQFPKDSSWINDAVLAGIGSAGTAYSTQNWRELAFIIRVLIAYKKLVVTEREKILKDGWLFAKWLEQIPGCNSRQLRHMILFLLFPDIFERIFGGSRRRKIVAAFSHKTKTQIKKLSALEIDKELAAIRKQQEQINNTTELDFYWPPLRDLWGDTKTTTWLLSWNPKNWVWESFAEDRNATHEGKKITHSWSCANLNASVGDQVYLIRVGMEPKGIIATGTIVTAPYKKVHWDEKKASEGKTRRCVDVSFTRIQNPQVNDPYISSDELNKITDDQQVWFSQSSGIEIKPKSVEILNKRWEMVVKPTSEHKPFGEVRPGYTQKNFIQETNISAGQIQQWQRILLRKKHIIFQGPPGTGKTFVAQRLARFIVSGTNGVVETIQFHPAYAYEDFVQGIRPEVIDGKLSYTLMPGRFNEFCARSESKKDAPCIMIIDEVNRANLSKVFGEMMYLLEYRDQKIPLSAGGDPFKIPENVFIIGTMNTADRSIALVDHALRRRFSFIRLKPDYNVLRAHLESKGYSAEGLISVLQEINKAIDDPNYELGISFFMGGDDTLKEHLPDIWLGEIEPYLEEFFYDQPGKVNPFRWALLIENKLREWA